MVHDGQRRSGLRSQITNPASTQTPTQTLDYGAIPVSEKPAPQLYPPIELEFPEDRASIQINLYRIADALARRPGESHDGSQNGYTDQPPAQPALRIVQRIILTP